jgi:hypothetical protein
MITFEQGLLRTFGRAYPVLMPVTGALLIIQGVGAGTDAGAPWYWLAAGAWAIATGTTLAVNVPINTATRTWDASKPPEVWQRLRRRWDLFQALRAWLLLLAFVLTALAFAAG